MDLGIRGKTALVCAASKGLGKGCAISRCVGVFFRNRNESSSTSVGNRNRIRRPTPAPTYCRPRKSRKLAP